MTNQIVTLDSLVQAKFVTISSVKHDDPDDGYDVCIQATNDPDVGTVQIHISKQRAEEMGLTAIAA